MCEKSVILQDYSSEIKRYCEDNALSARKVFDSYKAWNNEAGRLLILGEGDPERAKLGLKDKVPLPVLLGIYVENGKLRFEQTEHTRKYLGADSKAERRVA